MTSRTSVFQVKFTTDGSGAVKADIESVSKAAVDGSQRVNSQAGKEWEEFGYKIGKAIKYAGAAVLAGIGLIVKNTIQAEQELAQLDAVLKSTGNAAGFSRDQLVAMAEGIAQASTFSAGEITKAETRLLSYSGIAGTVFPQALQVAIDQAQRLGIGVEQSAETIGRALESPTKAAAALAQQGFGAAFTESVRDAIKALEDAGDTAGAQKIVIDILNESYQGAAKAARDTFGGAVVALKNQLADLMTGSDGSLDGATASVNELTATLNDPMVKSGFESIASGIASVTSELVRGIALLTDWFTKAKAAADLADGSTALKDAGYDDLLARQGVVSQQRRATQQQRTTFLGFDIPGAEEQRQQSLTQLDNERTAIQRELTRRILSERFDVTATVGGGRELAKQPSAGGTKDPSGARLKQVKAELSDYEKLMSDLGVYEQIWGDAAVDASNAKVDAWEAENEEQQRRAQIAQDVLADIQLENEAMGLSSEQIEIRNNLLRAGVEAESERGQAIVDATKQLQESREAWGLINDMKDGLQDLGVSAVMSFGHAGDAVEEFGERLKRMAAELLVQKGIELLFSMFLGGSYGQAGADSGTVMDLFGGSWGFADGGSPGGKVRGKGTTRSDSNLIRVSNEEWIINADASRHYGDDMLAAINAKTFAMGGPVSGYAGNAAAYAGGAGVPSIEFNVTNSAPDAEVGEPRVRLNEYGKMIVDLAVSKVTDGMARKGSAVNKAMRAGLAEGARYG